MEEEQQEQQEQQDISNVVKVFKYRWWILGAVAAFDVVMYSLAIVGIISLLK